MSETPPAPPPVARIPAGAVLKMLGGKFVVSSCEARHLVLTGPLHRLKRGQIMNLFGVVAQVTLVGKKIARVQARNGFFDTREILRLAPDGGSPIYP